MSEVEYLLSLKHRVKKDMAKIIKDFEEAESVEDLKKIAKKIGIEFDIKDFEEAKDFLAYHIVEYIFTKGKL